MESRLFMCWTQYGELTHCEAIGDAPYVNRVEFGYRETGSAGDQPQKVSVEGL